MNELLCGKDLGLWIYKWRGIVDKCYKWTCMSLLVLSLFDYNLVVVWNTSWTMIRNDEQWNVDSKAMDYSLKEYDGVE